MSKPKPVQLGLCCMNTTLKKGLHLFIAQDGLL